MKKVILLVIILVLQFQLEAQNQEKITEEFIIYKVKIMLNSQEKVDGVLFQVTDSSILISNSMRRYDYKVGKYEVTEYPLNQIEWVAVHRMSGGWAGGMIGLLVGGGVGFKIGRDRNAKRFFRKKNSDVKGLIIGCALGGTVGTLIGRKGVSRVSNHPDKVLRKLRQRAIKK